MKLLQLPVHARCSLSPNQLSFLAIIIILHTNRLPFQLSFNSQAFLYPSIQLQQKNSVETPNWTNEVINNRLNRLGAKVLKGQLKVE
jgi:hypothetical protein